MTSRRYTSFLLRCWLLDDAERRIKIEHIQSGQVTNVTTFAAALAWLEAHADDPEPQSDDQREAVRANEQEDERGAETSPLATSA